jgi:uncharacterized protein (TIGR03032 family)
VVEVKHFKEHSAQWRDPGQVIAQWRVASDVDPDLLKYRTVGRWWETLADLDATLLVTRETEHLVLAVRTTNAGPDISYIRLPHPSGMAVDKERATLHVASTRNPNQIFDFVPAQPRDGQSDGQDLLDTDACLMPIRSRLLPGSLYVHDLAVVDGRLLAAAVGQNAIVRVEEDGRYERVWWPSAVDTPRGPVFARNHLQLNSIAAGGSIADSYFSASTDRMSPRRPGHLNFAVDRRGVIFSGRTRDAVVGGLTRPHSVRLQDGTLWVDDSGYGTFGRCSDGRYVPTTTLPGWTRGLCFVDRTAFVGTSHVIPRFRRYAPGLDVHRSRCAVHAVDTVSGEVLGSIVWPTGNQIFGVEALDSGLASGLPFRGRRGGRRSARDLFYSFATMPTESAAAVGMNSRSDRRDR